MAEPLPPDPKLRRALEALDEATRLLRAERIRSANLRFALTKLQAGLAMDAKPVQRERRAG